MLSETNIGDYEIIKGGVLGTGAFATVWKGRAKKNHDQLVAIKAIKKKNFLKSQQLLSKEITILKELSSLHHQNVVGLLDCVELKDDVCLVMEYCNGGDLADCLHRNGTLSEDTLCSYVKQIGEAMKALQQKGIVHRDLKPQNILLCYEGTKYPHPSKLLLKIADFGFARFISGEDMATTLCGSPMYMAPEVIMSVKYTAKADLWSIGTILYQCLTGRAPFQAQNPQELKKKYEKTPGLKPNIPSSTSPELRDLLMRMLKRDAEERIGFEEFFNHPFLKLSTGPKVSQPVSVPRRRSSSSSESSTPGKSPGRNSPSSRCSKRTCSPAPPPPPVSSKVTAEHKEEDMVTTLTEAAGFTKVEKEEVRTGRSTPEDFVMVPEALCIESDGEESVSVRKAPLAEAEMSFSSSTHRSPKSIRIQGKEAVTFSKEKDEKEKESLPSSPSRPVTLPMATPKTSEPITVPSEMKGTGEGSDTCVADGANSGVKRKIKSPDVRMQEKENQDRTVARRNSEARQSGLDTVNAGSFSPPAVQFCVGTPPGGGTGPSWKRSSVVTPPPYSTGNLTGSPHRRGSVTSPLFNPLQLSNPSLIQPPGSLPTILGSPNKMPAMFHLGSSPHDNSPEPIHAPFAAACMQQQQGTTTSSSSISSAVVAGSAPYHTSNTVPDNLVAMARQRDALNEIQPMDYHRVSTDSSLLSHQLHNQNRQGMYLTRVGFAAGPVVSYGSRERVSSVSSDKDRFGSSLEQDRSPSFVRRNSGIDMSPPQHLLVTHSPPRGPPPHHHQHQQTTTTAPLRFVPQPLSEETLMDDNHNETLGKLSFVLDLVECILDLARSLGSAFRSLDPSEAKKVEQLSPEHYSQYRSSQRSLEQLVLYARACHLLNSALHMARDEIRNDRLQQSTNLRNVLGEMNTYYHHVVDRCKSIHKEFSQNCKTPLTQKLVMATADKLIYNQAIQMCQAAALDEFSQTPSTDSMAEIVRRYQVAQILLHSLAQTARNENDKHMLVKYRKSVESRLSVLTREGSHFDRHSMSQYQQTVDNQRFQMHS
ncbi:serine/threonine-protein kinase unc-51 [Aplysia californica]|uniref:Serine/threonine-protein kinase unc-51 n=1 Tax=Aplysia californica TaxID=6500 RepID=A0ABM0ZUZ6_APLCA|nr:serine/threonine-protein kinase unc-51 [Aplysia californica]